MQENQPNTVGQKAGLSGSKHVDCSGISVSIYSAPVNHGDSDGKRSTVTFCCGKRATSYRWVHSVSYEFGEAWEAGFRCKVCGRIRIPHGEPLPDRSTEYEAVRLAGMAFDEELQRWGDERRKRLQQTTTTQPTL